jgi:CDP-diacylglycerol--serine O-phosphatidyltransferase
MSLEPKGQEDFHERRRLRAQRNRRRAYIRSIYMLPSMATLGNAVCGLAAIYIASLEHRPADPWTMAFYQHKFLIAAYFIFGAMLFDGVDGRLARLTRHTTDFGGQLDSLADAISFGVAPAILMLQLMKLAAADTPFVLTRLIWAIGAIYMCCAIVRLARFNVSNEHGEQAHFSFLGLPSPGAAGVVAALVLLQQALYGDYVERHLAVTARGADPKEDGLLTVLYWPTTVVYWALPALTLLVGLLMVSTIRYPHLVNRYLRGRGSFGRLIVGVALLLAILTMHRYVLGILTLAYVVWGLWPWLMMRLHVGRGEQNKG